LALTDEIVVLAIVLIPVIILIIIPVCFHIRHIREKKQLLLKMEEAEIIDMINEALGYDVSEFKDKWLKRS